MRRLRPGTIFVLCALVTACGSNGDDSANDRSTTSSTPGDTSAPCKVITAEVVSAALGEKASYLGADISGCGYKAGLWTFGVNAVKYDPSAQGTAPTSPTIPGASAPHSGRVGNDRSGQWNAHWGMVLNDVLYVFTLRNDARGSDTYPPIEGPAQQPRTQAAAAALVNAVADAVCADASPPCPP